MSLDGKVAVVTGATKGVGRGIGRELARHGAQVYVTGRSAPEHERLVSGSRPSAATIGRAVAALAADPDVLRHTGKVLVAASLAIEYGFTDIDGTTPRPLTLADV